MIPTKTCYDVDGVRVTLIRDERGSHWQCARCEGRRCEHVIKAATWLTLEALEEEAASKLH